MKKVLLSVAAACMAISMLAQPQLTKNNIDDVLKAMTLEEKATLCVGGGWGSMTAGSLTAAGSYKLAFGASVADIRATATVKFAKAQSWPAHAACLPE